jgi:hypothetical protein
VVVEDRQAVKTSRAIMIGTVDDFAVEKFTSDPRTSPGLGRDDSGDMHVDRRNRGASANGDMSSAHLVNPTVSRASLTRRRRDRQTRI